MFYLCFSKHTCSDISSYLNDQLNHSSMPVCSKYALYREWSNSLKSQIWFTVGLNTASLAVVRTGFNNPPENIWKTCSEFILSKKNKKKNKIKCIICEMLITSHLLKINVKIHSECKITCIFWWNTLPSVPANLSQTSRKHHLEGCFSLQ